MNILITAGGTREYIDPVRFISNAGSGKMGLAVARAALKEGHKVRVISASDMKFPKHCEVIPAVTSSEMYRAVRENFKWADCLIMTAAVSDYKPVKTSAKKLKKA